MRGISQPLHRPLRTKRLRPQGFPTFNVFPHRLPPTTSNPAPRSADAWIDMGRHIQLRENEDTLSGYRNRLEEMQIQNLMRYEGTMRRLRDLEAKMDGVARGNEKARTDEKREAMKREVDLVKKKEKEHRDAMNKELKLVRKEREAVEKRLQSAKVELELAKKAQETATAQMQAMKEEIERMSKGRDNAAAKERDALKNELKVLRKKSTKERTSAMQEVAILAAKHEAEMQLREQEALARKAVEEKYEKEKSTTKKEISAMKARYDEVMRKRKTELDASLNDQYTDDVKRYNLKREIRQLSLDPRNANMEPINEKLAYEELEAKLDQMVDSVVDALGVLGPGITSLDEGSASQAFRTKNNQTRSTFQNVKGKEICVDIHSTQPIEGPQFSAPPLKGEKNLTSPQSQLSTLRLTTTIQQPKPGYMPAGRTSSAASLTAHEIASHVFVDASQTGIGMVVGTPMGPRWLAWRFLSTLEGDTVNPRIPLASDGSVVTCWAELIAFEMGVRTVLASSISTTPTTSSARKNTVIIRSDNMGVVDAVKTGRWTTKFDLDTILAKTLQLFTARACVGVDIAIEWVPTKLNPADKPSRGSFPHREDMVPSESRPQLPKWLEGILIEA